MKKLISVVLPLTLLLLIIFCTNCNNDPEPQGVLQLVSSTGQNYVSENRTIAGGTPVITGAFAQAPANNQSLVKFMVTFDHDSTDKSTDIIYLDSTLAPNTQTFAMSVAYTPRNLANKEIWKFIITDSEGKEYQRVIRLKTTSTVNIAKSAFYTYSNVLLSRVKNSKNTTDSIGLIGFASTDGTAFPAYAVRQAAIISKVDVTLNKAATQKPSLSLTELKGDSLRRTSLTPTAFDNIKNIKDLKAAFPVADPSASSISNLKVDEVLAYKSMANKVSLLRIKTVYKTLDSLSFDVKVEK